MPPLSSIASDRVRGYITSMQSLPGHGDTIEAAAERLSLSVRHFSTLFREITGTTWLRYHHLRRLKAAKILLRSGQLPIEEIAAQCGFDELTTFYRVFKRREGLSPGQWRALHAGATTHVSL